MTLQELLNSDIDLPVLARQGWGWWIEEMAAMLPPAWRARLSSRPRLLAEQIAPDAWRYWEDGRTIDHPPPGDGTAIVGLLLAPEAVLTREIDTPRMPAADLRRMLGFDLERLSPLAPELVHFDAEVVDRDLEDGRQRVRLGIVPRVSAAELVAAARDRGLAPVTLGQRVEGEANFVRFNFLPAVLEAAGEKPPLRARRIWWGIAAALLVVNLAVLVGRDMADVGRLKDLADAQAPAVNAALVLRRRVEAEERRRADMIAQGERNDPLRLLNALTEATPAGAWIQRLEWNGRTARIVGFRRPEVDLTAALRASGAFVNAHAQSPAAAAGAAAAFDISVDARPGAGR